jgi:dienelactone hydrolase
MNERSSLPPIARSARDALSAPSSARVIRAWAVALGTLSPLMAGCGSDASVFGPGVEEGGGGAGGSAGGAGGDGTSSSQGGGGATGGAGGAGASASGGSGNTGGVPDPELTGPLGVDSLSVTESIPATGNVVDIEAFYPSTANAGPYPVVLFGHGFQIAPSVYEGTMRHLASFGYVVVAVDFTASPFDVDHPASTQELLYGLDFAAANPTLAPISDADHAGASGHSLGGKLALYAGVLDERIAATFTFDPIDGGMSCSPAKCPDVSALLPLGIPTGFVGETTDATSSGFQSCAPAAQNFQTFFANASTPAIAVEALGANHVSFVDDPATCGYACGFCNAASAPQDEVLTMSRAMMVAFYERHLKGDVAYDTFLTGADANARYVATGRALLSTK